jgi:hypothetical protein
VCLVVTGKYIPALKFLDVLLSDQPVLAPHERLYQRLLANNPEEADELLESELEAHPLAAVCDRVVLPALQLLERDHEQGQLRESKRQYVLDHIERWSEELADTTAVTQVAAGESTSGVEVICLGAVDRADDITARLFALVLRESAFTARAAPHGALRQLEGAPAVIVISTLPRDGVTHARPLCRRAHALFPHTPVVVGLWHTVAELERCWARLAGAGATRLASSFAAGVLDVQALAARTEGPRSAATRPVPAVDPAPVRA